MSESINLPETLMACAEFRGDMVDLAVTKITNTIAMLPGWCPMDRARLFAELVFKEHIASALLIGVYGGRDTFAIALAMRERSLWRVAMRMRPEGMIHAVDPWSQAASASGMDGVNREWWGSLDHDSIFHGFMRKRAELELVDFCPVYRMTNREAWPRLRDREFDFIVIDGNHGEESVWDVEHFFPLLRPGGLIYMDDVVWTNKEGRGVTHAVELLETLGVERVVDIGTGRLYRRVG